MRAHPDSAEVRAAVSMVVAIARREGIQHDTVVSMLDMAWRREEGLAKLAVALDHHLAATGQEPAR